MSLEQIAYLSQIAGSVGVILSMVFVGLQAGRALDAADQLRLDMLLNEHLWAAFHIWDREQHGVFAPGTFELTGGALVIPMLATPGGGAWWNRAKSAGFLPPYVAVVDALLAARRQSI